MKEIIKGNVQISVQLFVQGSNNACIDVRREKRLCVAKGTVLSASTSLINHFVTGKSDVRFTDCPRLASVIFTDVSHTAHTVHLVYRCFIPLRVQHFVFDTP